MSDTDRAEIGKRHRTQNEEDSDGVPRPVAPSSDETPPPQIPPHLDDTLPLHEQVALLHAALTEHAEKMARLWDARHLVPHVERVAERIDFAASDQARTHALVAEFLMPSVKAMQAHIAELVQDPTRARMRVFFEHDWPRAIDQFKSIDTRIDGLGTSDKLQLLHIENLAKRIDESTNSLSKKVDTIVGENQTRDVKIRVLEDFKLSINVRVATIATLFSAAVVAVGLLLKAYG